MSSRSSSGSPYYSFVSMVIQLQQQHKSTDLGHRSSKDNNFVELSDPLHKLIDTRSLDDIDVVV